MQMDGIQIQLHYSLFLIDVFVFIFLLTHNFGHVNRCHCFDWFAPFFARVVVGVGVESRI